MAIANPIQLNSEDRLSVRKNIVDRCSGIVANYALYLLGQGGNATAEQTAWAKSAINSVATIGEQVSFHVLNQPSFLNGGSSIEDAELAGIVETAINSHFIAPAP
jgi:hypothetical protein